MIDFMARLDLFPVPFVKRDFATILDTGFTIPLIKRRVGIYIDFTRYMAVGGNFSLTFLSTNNLDAQVNLGPVSVTLTFTKPYDPKAFAQWVADAQAMYATQGVAQGTEVTELPKGENLPQ